MFAAKPATIVYRYVDPLGSLDATEAGSPSPQNVTITVWHSNAIANNAASSTRSHDGGTVRLPWYIPETGALSGSIWARLTITAGTNPTSGSVSTWEQISNGSNTGWVWERVSAGTTTATATLELSTDSGGSTIVVTQTGIDITVETS